MKDVRILVLSNNYDSYYSNNGLIYKINFNENDKNWIIDTNFIQLSNSLLSLSLYTYFPTRQRRDYYLMNYTIIPFNEAVHLYK